MRIDTIGPYRTINAYVAAKLNRFHAMERSFASMFELMFSERDNVLYEESRGYRIEKSTYGQAYDRVFACAGRLSGLLADLPADAVVGLYMDNSLDWIIAFWAILKCGFKPLLLNTRISSETLCETMESAGANTLITDGRSLSAYRALLFSEIEARPACALSDRPFGSEVLVISSGTTAAPKICAYSAEAFYYLVNDSYQIISHCKPIKAHYEGQLKLLTFLPFYHVFGLIAVYIWFAFFSRTFVHLADFSSQTILNTIRRHKVTHIFAVPMFWNEVHRQAIKTIRARGEKTWNKFCKGLSIAEKIADIPLLGSAFIRAAFREVRENLFGDSICFMITGGSEIRPEVLSFFNLIGYHLANGYGMTEVGITSVELSSKRRLLNQGFVGKPLSSVEYALSDSGVLLVRGASTAKYIIENGVTRPRSDWFETKDLAECVKGHYRILGRVDDVVISETGENLNPCLIEPLLANDSAYQLCLVGTAGENGAVPTLLVSAGRHLTAEKYESIREEIVGRLQENKLSSMIRKIVFVGEALICGDEIKLNRGRLAARCAAGELDVLTPAQLQTAEAENSALASYIRGLFAAAFEKSAADIGPETDFFLDEGGTSLDYFALVTKLQEEYGIRFPSAQERPLTTVRALCRFIEESLNHVD